MDEAGDKGKRKLTILWQILVLKFWRKQRNHGGPKKLVNQPQKRGQFPGRMSYLRQPNLRDSRFYRLLQNAHEYLQKRNHSVTSSAFKLQVVHFWFARIGLFCEMSQGQMSKSPTCEHNGDLNKPFDQSLDEFVQATWCPPMFSGSHVGVFSILTPPQRALESWLLLNRTHYLIKNLLFPFEGLCFPPMRVLANPDHAQDSLLETSSWQVDSCLLNTYYLPLNTNKASDLASESPISKMWPKQPLKYPKATGLLA